MSKRNEGSGELHYGLVCDWSCRAELHLLPPPALCLSLFLPRALSQWCCLIIWPGAEQKGTERREDSCTWKGERGAESELSFSFSLDFFTYKQGLPEPEPEPKPKPKPKPGFWTDFSSFPSSTPPSLLSAEVLQLPLLD